MVYESHFNLIIYHPNWEEMIKMLECDEINRSHRHCIIGKITMKRRR